MSSFHNLHLQEGVFGNVSRVAQRWDGSSTTLMKSITTSPAIEALEKQATTRFAVRQREKRLSNLKKQLS